MKLEVKNKWENTEVASGVTSPWSMWIKAVGVAAKKTAVDKLSLAFKDEYVGNRFKLTTRVRSASRVKHDGSLNDGKSKKTTKIEERCLWIDKKMNIGKQWLSNFGTYKYFV
jgi:hypothetical protein